MCACVSRQSLNMTVALATAAAIKAIISSSSLLDDDEDRDDLEDDEEVDDPEDDEDDEEAEDEEEEDAEDAEDEELRGGDAMVTCCCEGAYLRSTMQNHANVWLALAHQWTDEGHTQDSDKNEMMFRLSIRSIKS